MMNALILAIQFLTVLPVNGSFIANDKQIGKSALFYPVVGLIIGSLLTLAATIFSGLSLVIQSSLILTVWVLVTGALHLDGLADCADAWVGGLGNRQRSLEIMKDPASGPVAVIILILVLLLKWSFIHAILQQQNLMALFFTPMLGRLAILILMLNSQYIRPSGLGKQVVTNLPKEHVKIICFFCLAMSGFFLGWTSVVFALIILFIINHSATSRLGGVTGDVYGAAVELVEIGVLLGILI